MCLHFFSLFDCKKFTLTKLVSLFCNYSVEEMIDQLLKEVIEHDLVLKVVLDEAEMLVFPSVLLPKDHKSKSNFNNIWNYYY